jgi:NADPH2 dehydrogenase
MKNRLSPLQLNSHITLNNRIVVPSMASATADNDGFVTNSTLAHYSRLAESKAGLIFVEYSFVDTSGRSEENQLGINDDLQVLGLTLLAKNIHYSGSVAAIQLTHSGGKTESKFTGGRLFSPSGITVPVKDQVLETPDVMDATDIQKWKSWFLDAAKRAVRAKFDLIELHAAHGYGLNQWLSPITNKRTDHYGGSILNNVRILLEIIEEIRFHYPNLLISVRMPGQDFLDDGLGPSDCIVLAKEIEKAGADIINISSGIGGWRRPGSREGEGYLVEEAALIQQEVSVPVIGVGGIESANYIDEIIMKNKVSLAAIGRAILKDPKAWAQNELRSL